METGQLTRYMQFRPAWKSFGVYFLGAAIFFFGPMINPQAPISPALSDLIATCFMVFILIQRFTKLYETTQEQVTRITSFPRRDQKSVAIKDIRRIDLRRGITQRILGVAHVHLYVQGQEDPALKLFGVPDPETFRDLLRELGAGDERVTGAWRK